MIRIDRLRLRLPAQFRAHAEVIARHIGDQLARVRGDCHGDIGQLITRSIRVGANATPDQVASAAAAEILQQIRRHQE